MARITILAFAWAALLTASAAGAATQVQRSIPFDEGAGGSEKVRSECQIQTRVPEAVKEFAADVELVDGALNKNGRALELSIMEVHAPGGGPFSGPKWMAVYGKLYEKGKMVGSFRAKRLSTGAFRGTCSTLARCAQSIGEDIAKWLQAPSMDAELGDAR
jgi:hypothetical protein